MTILKVVAPPENRRFLIISFILHLEEPENSLEKAVLARLGNAR